MSKNITVSHFHPAALPNSVPPMGCAVRLAMVAPRLSVSTFCNSARMSGPYSHNVGRRSLGQAMNSSGQASHDDGAS